MQQFASLVFRHARIQSVQRLRDALKHNRREFAMDGPSHAHISSDKSHLNFSIFKGSTTKEDVSAIYSAIGEYQETRSRKIHKSAILGIELIFSVPAHRTDIDLQAFFQDSFDWACKSYVPLKVISAEVHLDESHPHMHILFSCIQPDVLLGSKIYASPRQNKYRVSDFQKEVGLRHGLVIPLRLSKADRARAVNDIIESIKSRNDSITGSVLYPLMRTFAELDTWSVAQALGVEIKLTPPKQRTFVQIMTSKGKGDPDIT
jgi:hypothetical protein